jgi:TolB-like protein
MTKSDNLLAEFSSMVDATNCAVEIHRGLKTKNGGLPDKPSIAALPFDNLSSDSKADFYFSITFD